MRISFKRLWKKLDRKHMKKDLMERAGRICAVFRCSVDEILEIDPDSAVFQETGKRKAPEGQQGGRNCTGYGSRAGCRKEQYEAA